MRLRTRITQTAREYGLTAREVGRRLKLYPSNISASDSGRRSISLKLLGRIAEVIGCGPSDLIEIVHKPPFRSRYLIQRLDERANAFPDGTDKTWVHRTLLAWQRHYRSVRRKP